MAEVMVESTSDNDVMGVGSADVRGSVPKDLSSLGNDLTTQPDPEIEISKKTEPAPTPPAPEKQTDKQIRVPLATMESLSDPPPERCDDGIIIGPSEPLYTIPEVDDKRPILESKVPEEIKDNHRFVGGKPQVEMILIDRSSENAKMLRIDEHMNVSPYKEGSGYRKALCGVIISCALVMTMTLVIILAKRNHVNQHAEITSLAVSLDLTTEGAHPLHLRGWHAWEMSLSRPKSRQERDLDGNNGVITYILLRDDYDDVRLKAEGDFVITYQKGCQITVHVDIYEGPRRTNTSSFLLGDPTIHTSPNTFLTYHYYLPKNDKQLGVYVNFDAGFDGFRSYSLFSIYSKQDILAHIIYGVDPEVIKKITAVSPPSGTIQNCSDSSKC